mmetsp:Transcript_48465/g.128367  ORF Transcript_48465/g.128367 Transcript_48465/m.128367 type:complete len:355 (-) Transcript_48465:242-1306(-)
MEIRRKHKAQHRAGHGTQNLHEERKVGQGHCNGTRNHEDEHTHQGFLRPTARPFEAVAGALVHLVHGMQENRIAEHETDAVGDAHQGCWRRLWQTEGDRRLGSVPVCVVPEQPKGRQERDHHADDYGQLQWQPLGVPHSTAYGQDQRNPFHGLHSQTEVEQLSAHVYCFERRRVPLLSQLFDAAVGGPADASQEHDVRQHVGNREKLDGLQQHKWQHQDANASKQLPLRPASDALLAEYLLGVVQDERDVHNADADIHDIQQGLHEDAAPRPTHLLRDVRVRHTPVPNLGRDLQQALDATVRDDADENKNDGTTEIPRGSERVRLGKDGQPEESLPQRHKRLEISKLCILGLLV